MRLRLLSFDLYISFPLVAGIAILVIVDDTMASLCCIAAAASHEIGHLLAMRAFNTLPKKIDLSLFDINIKDPYKDTRPVAQEIAVTCSGPLVNFVLAAVFYAFGLAIENELLLMFCYANLFLGVFNSLPVESLDGGTALFLLLRGRLGWDKADKAVEAVSFLILCPMAVLGFFLLLESKYNFTLLFNSCYLMALLIFKRVRYR